MTDTIAIASPGVLRIFSEHLAQSFLVRTDDIVSVKEVGLRTTYITTRGARRNLFVGLPRAEVREAIKAAKPKPPPNQLELFSREECP